MSDHPPKASADAKTTDLSPEALRARLTADQYRVTQEAGTERPFTGEYWDEWSPGSYACVVCGTHLFDSDSKFDAGCGWPSFTKAFEAGSVAEREDRTHGMVRTEVVCATCGGHLGHVFPDGPAPLGTRYCINSASLSFAKREGTG